MHRFKTQKREELKEIGSVNIKEFYLEDEIAQFRQVFASYDPTGRGFITAPSVTEVLKEMGIQLKGYQVDAYIKEYDDGENNNTVDFEEFMSMMITINSKKPRPDSIDYREYLSDKVIEELDLAFREADDGNGTLDKSEIMKIFKERGISFTSSQMDAIFSQVDADGSGAVSFPEFCNLVVSLTGTRKRLNAHEFLDDDEMTALRKAFQEFDHSGDGSIDTAELTTIFRTMGLALAEDKEHEVVTKYDVDGSGEMEFDEFVTMMVDLKKMRKKRNINPTTIQAKQLRTLGFAAKEVRSLGYSPQLMRQDGYTANEMVAAKFTPSQLRHAGFRSNDMRNAGMGPTVMKRSGYSATDLRNRGYSHAALRANARSLHANPKDVPLYTNRRAQSAPRLSSHSTPRIRHFVDHEHQTNLKGRGTTMKKKFKQAGNVLQSAIKAVRAADNFMQEAGVDKVQKTEKEQTFKLLRDAQQLMRSDTKALEEAEAAQRPGRRRVSTVDVDVALGIPPQRPVTR